MPSRRTKPKKIRHNIQTLDPAKRRGLGFVVVGCLLMLVVVAYRFQQARRLSFNLQADQVQASSQSKALTKKISLSKYKVTLDVTQASIIDGVWQINETTANHLESSANPGEDGNIVIYGHNSREVFGPLRWMSPGEVIELTNDKGEVLKYTIKEIIETNPEDITWVLPKDRETLTVYTCSGFLNSKRHVVVAYPEN